jgi:hypothetical protein
MSACVAGEMERNKTACLMILSKVVEDPQSGSCLNVSYADVSGPVANYNPTGSPYANHTGQHTPVQAGNFNSSPSLSSSISTGKLKFSRILWFLCLANIHSLSRDLSFSILAFARVVVQFQRPGFLKYYVFHSSSRPVLKHHMACIFLTHFVICFYQHCFNHLSTANVSQCILYFIIV